MTPTALQNLLTRLWHQLSRRRQLQFRLLMALTLVSAFAEVTSLGAVLPFLGILAAPDSVFSHPIVSDMAPAWGIASADQLVLPLTVAFAAAALMAGAIRILLLWASTRLAFASGADLGIEVYRRTLYQPYRVHVARNSSEVISGITKKVNGVVFGVLLPLLTVVSSTVLLVAIMLALIAVDPMVASVAAVGFGFSYALITWMSRQRLHRNSQRIGLGGIRDVLLDGTQPIYCDIYRQADHPLRRAQGNNFFISGSPRPAMEAMGVMLIICFGKAICLMVRKGLCKRKLAICYKKGGELMFHEKEVSRRERFEFGANWLLYLKEINEDRIRMAEESLKRMLNLKSLSGKTFLDIGSGSGLFSLAARRLGAKVHSLDFDPQSVACTRQLRERFYVDDTQWIVEEGSVLDENYLLSLDKFDVVYSWGVLHHTGKMWTALTNAGSMVTNGGLLFISIYNDQGVKTPRWILVKRAYNILPKGLRWIVWLPCLIKLWWPSIVRDFLRGRPFQSWVNYSKVGARGMSAFRDLIDWVGGLPFEVAKPEEIYDFYHEKDFVLERMKTCGGGIGCNEFVFSKKTI